MFKKYYIVHYEDLFYTLEKENIGIEKYQEMKNKGVKLYSLYNCRIFKCKKRDLVNKVNQFFNQEIKRGNEIKILMSYDIRKEYAQELARKNHATIIE